MLEKSLSNYDDLKGGGDPNMDPLKVFETYYRETMKCSRHTRWYY